jgi:ferritin-like metal-binding protein YciE
MQIRSNGAMASEKNPQELFHETLKDIYFAEKKILSALPEMANAAQWSRSAPYIRYGRAE